MTNPKSLILDAQQLRELLPFYANQTLAGAQTAQVKAALERFPELQAELLWLQTLRQTLKEQPLDSLPAGDLGWSQLAQRVADEGAPRASTPMVRQTRWQDALLTWLQGHLMPVMATACVLLIVQSLMIGTLLNRDQVFVAAGAGEPRAGAAKGVILHITIHPSVTEPTLREALRRFNANIVQGPSALGIYTVEINMASDLASEPRAATQVATRLLREAADVFETVTAAGP